METETIVLAGHSFLDLVYHARTMEHLRREAIGGRDKRARLSGKYSGSQFRDRESYDRPRQRFQQGQSGQRVQEELHAIEGDKYIHGISCPKHEGRNWNLIPKLRPELTLLNHLLMAHGSHIKSRRQISISWLKNNPSAGKAFIHSSTKKTTNPNRLYEAITNQHKRLFEPLRPPWYLRKHKHYMGHQIHHDLYTKSKNRYISK